MGTKWGQMGTKWGQRGTKKAQLLAGLIGKRVDNVVNYPQKISSSESAIFSSSNCFSVNSSGKSST